MYVCVYVYVYVNVYVHIAKLYIIPILFIYRGFVICQLTVSLKHAVLVKLDHMFPHVKKFLPSRSYCSIHDVCNSSDNLWLSYKMSSQISR